MKNVHASVLLLLLALSLPGQAEEPNIVRVEVIVFQHADGQPDRWPTGFEDTFVALPDPIERARLATWTARVLPVERGQDLDLASSNPAQADLVAIDPAADPVRVRSEHSRGPVWPDFKVALPQLSGTMQRALDRLQSSEDHRVLTSLGWLQPLARQISTSPVRIRGNQALAVDWTTPVSTGILADPAVQPPSAKPAIRYRLDGSAQVRQRQFRHLDLDLVWSDPAPDPELARENEHDVLIHRLELSRPIELDRLEYFDSSWLGVLVLIEEWEPGSSSDTGQR